MNFKIHSRRVRAQIFLHHDQEMDFKIHFSQKSHKFWILKSKIWIIKSKIFVILPEMDFKIQISLVLVLKFGVTNRAPGSNDE